MNTNSPQFLCKAQCCKNYIDLKVMKNYDIQETNFILTNACQH